ncbi:anti-sigma factor family protein [Paraburkholderia pallida]|uniref:Anti-sigma factor n=1 Tax=Paraburkholderia pallida TaxID=2547399 RepID=A0A4P7D669_9BURK|nr:hypothetical protein [Paraburkholderia pallida]QBR02112.1 hypothetical protein E1956_33925 [Paraburkholderia pallida]
MRDDLNPTAGASFSEPALRALSAFVDGELSYAECQRLAERLTVDRCAANAVAHYRAQRAALRALFADLAAQANVPCVVLRVRMSWWRRTALAVGALFAGAALAVLAAAMSSHSTLPATQMSLDKARPCVAPVPAQPQL